MFHPLANLFTKPNKVGWGKDDIKYFIQNYLRDRLKTEALYCDDTSGGQVTIRVNTAALKQEIMLLEYDLSQELKKQTNYDLEEIKIEIRS